MLKKEKKKVKSLEAHLQFLEYHITNTLEEKLPVYKSNKKEKEEEP